MLAQIISLLLGTAASLLAIAFLARTLLQMARAPFRNPLGQFITALTNWAVLPCGASSPACSASTSPA